MQKLVWSDEFDYTGIPDPAKWNHVSGGHGFGNNELQFYTDRPANSYVKDSCLIIEAHPEEYENRHYTSACLTTQGKGDWLYGRIEVKAKLPAGLGTWPAIWMVPTNSPYGNGHWPDNGEIDIMEHLGRECFDENGKNFGLIRAAVHTGAYNHKTANGKGDKMAVLNTTGDWHRYGLIWTAETITALVDDTPFFSYTKESDDTAVWPFNWPFHLILNVAIGGWGGDVAADIFPVKMMVDYVRVYQ